MINKIKNFLSQRPNDKNSIVPKTSLKPDLSGLLPLSRKIFEYHQVRNTEEQKKIFRELFKNMPGVTVERQDEEPYSNNLVIGDVEKATVILSAHYDTPKETLIDRPKSPQITWKYIVGCIMCSIIVCLAFMIAKLQIPLTQWLCPVIACVVFAIIAIIVDKKRDKKPNSNNANDNTSGVITICELIHSFTDVEKSRIAFVLFDNEELKYKGSEYFKKHHTSANLNKKLIINFDCVADGNYMMFVFNSKDKMDAENVKKQKQAINRAFSADNYKREKANSVIPKCKNINTFKTHSDHVSFENSIGIGAFHRNKLGIYYISHIHTKRDTNFDVRNIHYLVEGTKRLLKELH